MEDLQELTDFTARKESIISKRKSTNLKKESIKDIPNDNWNLCYVVFFFYGLGSFLPLPFIVTAHDYWMFKFRDTSVDYIDNNKDRTTMQANFLASISLAHIPGSIICALTARYGHRYNLRSRLLVAIGISTLIFLLHTSFIYVDTDSWQLEFFIMSAGFVAITQCLVQIFTVSEVSLVSRFPRKYLKAQMYGQSIAGVLSGTTQIVALSVGDNDQSVALIYFSIGTIVLLVTFILTYMSKFLDFYNFYQGDMQADTKRAYHTIDDYISTFKKFWPVLIMSFNFIVSIGMSFPNIANLVVSEHHGNLNSWNDVYFTPVTTYLLPELFSISARFLSGPFMTRKNSIYWVVVQTLFIYTTSPLFLFCNTNPKHHLPVLLKHDWQFITLILTTIPIKTFFTTVGAVSMKNLAEDDIELGFIVQTTVLQITGCIAAPLNSVFVNIL